MEYAKKLKETHPIYFEKATNRNSNKRDFEVMYFMLDMKAKVDRGELTHNQATQYIQMYMVKQCSTGKTEAEYKAEQEAKKKKTTSAVASPQEAAMVPRIEEVIDD
jgi:hypothetical protein